MAPWKLSYTIAIPTTNIHSHHSPLHKDLVISSNLSANFAIFFFGHNLAKWFQNPSFYPWFSPQILRDELLRPGSMQSYARVFTAMAVQDCGGANEVDDLCLGSIEGKLKGEHQKWVYILCIHTHIYIIYYCNYIILYTYVYLYYIYKYIYIHKYKYVYISLPLSLSPFLNYTVHVWVS